MSWEIQDFVFSLLFVYSHNGKTNEDNITSTIIKIVCFESVFHLVPSIVPMTFCKPIMGIKQKKITQLLLS